MPTDNELLRRYAEGREEAAFAELVRRHVDRVYAVALRQTAGDAHLAADVTQRVFGDLARKARALRRHPALAGWLHRAAHFAASDLVRAERRRRAREQEAQLMREVEIDESAAEPESLRPLLDAAVAELRETDRAAIALRFFEARTFAEIGARLRLSDDAARMRVERALEKLRGALARRGVASTGAAVATVLGAQATTQVPAGLVAKLTVQAAAMAPAGWLAVGALEMAAVVALMGAVGVLGWQQAAKAEVQAEFAALQEMRTEMHGLRAENARLARAQMEATSSRMMDAELAELQEKIAELKVRLATNVPPRPTGETMARISGSVKQAGRIALTGGKVMTIAEAIKLAGGLTELAMTADVRVTRRQGDGSLRVYRINAALAHEAAFEVEADDVIYVPERIL